MKIILLIIISLLNLFNFSCHFIDIRTSLDLHLLDLAAKGDTLSSQMCRPVRDLGRWVARYVRRLRFASPTVNKVLSLRDLSNYKKYTKNLTALPFAGFSWLFKEKISHFFWRKRKNRRTVVPLQSACNATTVRLQHHCSPPAFFSLTKEKLFIHIDRKISNSL
jgi:hypothetical protein